MKKFLKRVLSGALAFTTCLSLAACASGDDGAIKTAEPDVLDVQLLTQDDAQAQNVARGANEFAFNFSAAMLSEKEEGANFVCSPYSVYLPLAALVNATQDQHRPALLQALSAEGASEEEINIAAARMLYSLQKTRQLEYDAEYPAPLKIANAIFVSQDKELKESFAKTFATYFSGAVIPVDFTSSDAADKVNAWASENTDGLIDNIIDKFDDDAVAAIANAIYFSDKWAVEFDEALTYENTFHTPEGDVQAMFMVKDGEYMPYYDGDEMQAVNLRFQTGGGLYIMLPKTGTAEELLAGLTVADFEEIEQNSDKVPGRVELPRFKIESGVMSLNDALKALGVPLFDCEAAPLTGGLLNSDDELFISSAVQRAVIDVNEVGTTAAAVTVMQISTNSLPLPAEPFEMVCDRPFAFVLYDYTADGGYQVLFTGVLNQP